jgi:hypothetical protein
MPRVVWSERRSPRVPQRRGHQHLGAPDGLAAAGATPTRLATPPDTTEDASISAGVAVEELSVAGWLALSAAMQFWQEMDNAVHGR